MALFHLQIVTPDRMVFDGQAEKIILRTVGGDVCILARHIDYAAALDIGEAHVTFEDGSTRFAACSGGLLSVHQGQVKVIATTFEWADEIDAVRAALAQKKAEERLKELKRDDEDYALAEARLKRALIRQRVKG